MNNHQNVDPAILPVEGCDCPPCRRQRDVEEEKEFGADLLAKAHLFVGKMVSRADYNRGGQYLWYGWALREAFLAGFKAGQQHTSELENRPVSG